MELLHNLQPSLALMYTVHTITHLLTSAGERPVAAEGSPPLWGMGLLGKEKSESEVAEAL